MSLLTIDRYATFVDDINDNEGCKICLENLSHESLFDETLGVIRLNTCGHQFHAGCMKRLVRGRDYLQCPTCRTIHGTKTGDQPLSGQMTWSRGAGSLPGYPDNGIISITYNMLPGIQTKEHPHPGKPYQVHGFPRTAFLPDTPQGHTVLQMMITAFQRRLTFTISTSLTTGLNDHVVWSGVHHKTKIVETGDGHGYPDVEYLDAVAAELEREGVKQY